MTDGPGPVRSEGPTSVPGWVREAEPPVPDEFAPWLVGPDTEGASLPTASALEALAQEALDRSASGERTERAFHLLAADAYLTWASEAALSGPAPAETLAALARRVAAGS